MAIKEIGLQLILATDPKDVFIQPSVFCAYKIFDDVFKLRVLPTCE